jgi:hypothetical protein
MEAMSVTMVTSYASESYDLTITLCCCVSAKLDHVSEGVASSKPSVDTA